jgi:hypothetical protein
LNSAKNYRRPKLGLFCASRVPFPVERQVADSIEARMQWV